MTRKTRKTRFDTVLEKFEGATPNRDGGVNVLCPAHEDHTPSLTISEGGDGRVLLYCHAGCSLQAILEKCGLNEKDLFAQNGKGREEPTVYPYTDEDGDLLYEVLRYDTPEGKTFKQRRPDGEGWVWKLDGVRRVLYHLPDLNGKNAVLIPEGEKDVDRLRSLRIPATTNSGGAGKWTDEHTQQLVEAGVKKVGILPDRDEAGERHAQKVARSCLQAGLSVKIVQLPGLRQGGDVSDWLDAGHSDELRALVNTAKQTTLEDLEDLEELREPEEENPQPGAILRPLSDIEPREIDWLWKDRIPLGMLTLFVGDPGIGKSLLTVYLAAQVSRGGTWPDGTSAPHGAVILLEAEDPLHQVVRPRFDAAEAEISRVLILEGVNEGGAAHGFSLRTDLDALRAAIHERKARLVVIDPLNAYLGGTDTHKDVEVRAVLTPLSDLAEETGAAVVAVMHLNKTETMKSLYRIGGSIAFSGVARVVYMVDAAPEDEGKPNAEKRRLFMPTKANMVEALPTLAFKVGPGPTIEWLGETAHTAEQVLAPKDRERRDTRIQQAIEFLKDAVEHGPVRKRKILEEAEERGISERTLERGKAQLEIIARSRHSKKGIEKWYWMLPEHEDKFMDGSPKRAA